MNGLNEPLRRSAAVNVGVAASTTALRTCMVAFAAITGFALRLVDRHRLPTRPGTADRVMPAFFAGSALAALAPAFGRGVLGPPRRSG